MKVQANEKKREREKVRKKEKTSCLMDNNLFIFMACFVIGIHIYRRSSFFFPFIPFCDALFTIISNIFSSDWVQPVWKFYSPKSPQNLHPIRVKFNSSNSWKISSFSRNVIVSPEVSTAVIIAIILLLMPDIANVNEFKNLKWMTLLILRFFINKLHAILRKIWKFR